MTSVLWLVVRTIGSLLASACLLRALAYHVRLPVYHPISQFVCAVTDWAIKPLRRLIPARGRTDWTSLAAALLLAVLTAALASLVFGQVPLPARVILHALLWLLDWSLRLLVVLLVLQAILSWVNPHAPMAPALDLLTTPFLSPVRRILPAVGGFDLSPMVLMFAAWILREWLQGLAF
jgi:YggT family protein